MVAELYIFATENLTVPTAFFREDFDPLNEETDGDTVVPVPAYLVVHPDGKLIFDTGLTPQARTGAVDYSNCLINAFNAFHFPVEQAVSSLRYEVHLDTGDVNYVINSHLRAGCTIYTESRSLAGRTLIPVDTAHDLFGDGSVVCIPSVGHSRGHRSLLVRAGSAEVILTPMSAICAMTCRTCMCQQLSVAILPQGGLSSSYNLFRTMVPAAASGENCYFDWPSS